MPENTDAPVKVSDRRSVVKTAANLAWAIPAVQVAAAAPALAASGVTTTTLTVVGSHISGTGLTQVFDFTITNTGSIATTALQLTISSSTATLASETSTTSGWAGTGPTFTAATQLASGASTTVRVTVTRTAGTNVWSVVGSATASNAAAASSGNVAAGLTPVAFNVSGTATATPGSSTTAYNGSYTVTNTGQAGGAPTVTVTIHGLNATPAVVAGSGWSGSFSQVTAQNSTSTATLTHASVNGLTSTALGLTFTIKNSEKTKDITVSVAPAGTSPSVSQTFV